MVDELLHRERRKIELRGGATTNDLGRGWYLDTPRKMRAALEHAHFPGHKN